MGCHEPPQRPIAVLRGYCIRRLCSRPQHRGLLPNARLGALALGAGSTASQAVQLHQIFAGYNNHMRSDTTAYVLWDFGNEILGNVRSHNSTTSRNSTEQILAYNGVTIDRSDMSSRTPTATATATLLCLRAATTF